MTQIVMIKYDFLFSGYQEIPYFIKVFFICFITMIYITVPAAVSFSTWARSASNLIQFTFFAAISEVYDKADRKPNSKPHPIGYIQFCHHVEAAK